MWRGDGGGGEGGEEEVEERSQVAQEEERRGMEGGEGIAEEGLAKSHHADLPLCPRPEAQRPRSFYAALHLS